MVGGSGSGDGGSGGGGSASDIAENLRRLRKAAGLGQRELAERAGLTQSAYSRLETGSRRPGVETLSALAAALGVAPGALLAKPPRPGPGSAAPGSPPPSSPDAGAAAAEFSALPLLGRIPAGPPTEVDPDAESYPVLRQLARQGRFVLRAEGHSMSPEIKHGDMILVETVEDARPEDLQGRICICSLNGRFTMKRVIVEVRRGRRCVVLRGDNPESPAIAVAEDDDFRIQGRVLAVVGRVL
jgi:SOS-response transcriptional repressor LexA